MGQKLSRDELLYQQVNHGNSERIKALSREGAGLEWTDREGKTPLIVACMHPELFHVAKTLIELGANVNAFRRGFHGGTPLHHAAEKGLDQTVKLLLSHGANALVTNDGCQTPLDIARVKGYNNVVSAIESHICLFSGWMRELYGPGLLEVLAPGWVSRKIWVVVVPCGSHRFKKHLKSELAIYPSSQDTQPRTVIALWKAKIKRPKFRRADPSLIIFDKSTKTRYRLISENEGDKQQIQWLYRACKGISPVLRPPSTNTRNPVVSVTALPSTAEDVEVAGPSGSPTQHVQSQHNIPATVPTTHEIPIPASSIPSAPPIIEEVIDDGSFPNPSIDSSPISLSTQTAANKPVRTSEVKEDEGVASSCVICLDAEIEGACIPCGHMAGCMSCLNEIKAKKWGCPVCRANIDQVMKVYSV